MNFRRLSKRLAVAVLLAWPAAPLPAAPPPQPGAQALRQWLADLSAPEYAVRQRAVERLYAAGPAALQALGQAATGGEVEAALRAQQVIERISRLYFVGARVELALAPAKIRWNEPVTLSLKIVNDHEFAVQVPFLTAGRERVDRGRAALQLGTMLDAADYLEVYDPQGRRLQLTVDDMRGHAALEYALDFRVRAGPRSLIRGQDTFTLTAFELNRGVARYRMLQAGEYRIRFNYVPEWDIPEMVERRVGQVTSNTATLEIASGAPQVIGDATALLTVSVHRAGRELVVGLQNTYDRPIGVNLNFGRAGDMYRAQLKLSSPGQGLQAVSYPFDNAGPPAPQAIRTLAPNEQSVIVRLSVARVRQLFGANIDKVAVTYLNLLDAALLQRTPPPAASVRDVERLLEAMPVPMFSGQAYSPVIELTE